MDPHNESNESAEQTGEAENPGVAPETTEAEPAVLGEIAVEELAIDGICGVY